MAMVVALVVFQASVEGWLDAMEAGLALNDVMAGGGVTAPVVVAAVGPALFPGAGGRDRGQTRAAVAAGGRPRGAGFVVVPVDGVGIPIGFGDLLGVDEIGATLLVILLYLKLHVGDGSADAQVFEADDHLLARIRGAVLQPDGERIHGAAAGIDIVGIAAADVDFVILAACISVSPVLEGNRDR